MNKQDFIRREAKKIHSLKLQLENTFKRDLKVYFNRCKVLVKNGHGNNLPSIKSVLKNHNERVIKSLFKINKKSADWLKLYNLIYHVNDKNVNKQSTSVDSTTKDRLEKSLQLARESFDEKVPDSILLATAANIFQTYNTNRIETISTTSNNTYLEHARSELIDESRPYAKDYIKSEDDTSLLELAVLTGCYAFFKAHEDLQDLPEEDYTERNSDKHDIEKELDEQKKVWISMNDDKTRDSHLDADGQEQNIDEPFEVGDSLLMEPGDDSLGADIEEIANCRCVKVT